MQEMIERREKLLHTVRDKYSDKPIIFLCIGNLEPIHGYFLQESSFWYLTGCETPGAMMLVDEENVTSLYIPSFTIDRSVWMQVELDCDSSPAEHGVDRICPLGQPTNSYQLYPYGIEQEYQNIITALSQTISRGARIATLVSSSRKLYVEQKILLEKLCAWTPGLKDSLIDVSAEVHALRRTKSPWEIEQLQQAIHVTAQAHARVADIITRASSEKELHAAIEHCFIENVCTSAYTSIVGSGKQGTILHYIANNQQLYSGELVVVDAGARYNHYCADITRTFAVSGEFTTRQRELYDIVLAVQEEIARIAAPSMWLSSAEHPEQSLNHIAKKLLAQAGYEKYFPHGIGHYLGLDVHDVGDYSVPLQPGDVITIEPGIYIPEEGIGIRIEDNYLITESGAYCLSTQIPKQMSNQ